MLSQRLRHRVEIQERTETTDATTGESLGFTWDTLTIDGVPMDIVPAEVLTGPGREPIAADAKWGETTARITLRWFPITPEALMKCRILWDGRVLNIIAAETDVTARREWRLKCADGVDGGY